jgi:hypothetical protein
VSCITILWMSVRRTRYVNIVCVKWWTASTLLLRHNSEYFVKYQNMILEKPTDDLKYRERRLDENWRWVYWDQVNGQGSCKIHYIEKRKKPHLPQVSTMESGIFETC